MRTPALALLLSFALATNAPSFPRPESRLQRGQTPSTSAQHPGQPSSPNQAPASAIEAGQFALQDGTPIKLRISRNVSSADATVGESVDFEVLDELTINGITVIPKGGTAIGTVTEAVPKRRMGRAGKLEIVLDYVRLADSEKAPVRAVKDAKGGSHVGGMTIGIVATGLLFFPAAPLFLLMHGKDITVPKGAEVTAYVNGDMKLVQARFQLPSPDASVAATASNDAAPAPGPGLGTLEVHSNPDGAEVYADEKFIGGAPATLKLQPGQHTIKVILTGYKDWSRQLTVQAGSDAHLTAILEKVQASQ